MTKKFFFVFSFYFLLQERAKPILPLTLRPKDFVACGSACKAFCLYRVFDSTRAFLIKPLVLLSLLIKKWLKDLFHIYYIDGISHIGREHAIKRSEQSSLRLMACRRARRAQTPRLPLQMDQHLLQQLAQPPRLGRQRQLWRARSLAPKPPLLRTPATGSLPPRVPTFCPLLTLSPCACPSAMHELDRTGGHAGRSRPGSKPPRHCTPVLVLV